MKTRFRIAASVMVGLATALARRAAPRRTTLTGGARRSAPTKGTTPAVTAEVWRRPEAPHHRQALKLFVSPAGTNRCALHAARAHARRSPKRSRRPARGRPSWSSAANTPKKCRSPAGSSSSASDAPIINALGLAQRHQARRSRHRGLADQGVQVEHGSEFEGILALSTTGVKIVGNEVRENDLGNKVADAGRPVCRRGPDPGRLRRGDPSHGHLVLARQGKPRDRQRRRDPADRRDRAHRIQRNRPQRRGGEHRRLWDHARRATAPKRLLEGKPQPKKAGIFDNKIVDNIWRSRTASSTGAARASCSPRRCPGAGSTTTSCAATAPPKTACRGSRCTATWPGQDLNGNKFIDNELSNNGGTGNMGMPGDAGTSLEDDRRHRSSSAP